MSTDEDFAIITQGIEIDIPEGFEYKRLSGPALMMAMTKIRKDMMDRGVLLCPETGEDMDKQSVYFGLLNEMRRRGLI